MKTVDTRGPRIESLLRSLTTCLYIFSVGRAKETWGSWLVWSGSAGGMGGALGRPLLRYLGLQEEIKKSLVELQAFYTEAIYVRSLTGKPGNGSVWSIVLKKRV